MDCGAYQRWLSSYIDELLEPSQRAELEQHLPGCDRCRADLASLQRMLRALRTLESPAPPDLLPGIHEQLLREPWWRGLLRRFAAPWPASLPLHGAALAAAAVLIVAIVGVPTWITPARERRLELAEQHQPSPREKRAVRALADAETRVDRLQAQVEMSLGKPIMGMPGRTHLSADAAIAVAGPAQLEHEDAQVTAQLAPAVANSFTMGRTLSDAQQQMTTVAGNLKAAAVGGDTARSSLKLSTTARARPSAPVDVAAGLEVGAVAKAELESAPSAGTSLHLRWRVDDPATVVSYLSAWLGTVNGQLLAADADHLIMQLPAIQYPKLLDELRWYGRPLESPAPASEHSVRDTLTIRVDLLSAP